MILVEPGIYQDTTEIAAAGKNATILKADGGKVTIECADSFHDSLWTQQVGNVYKANRWAKAMNLPTLEGQDFASEVFEDSVRYTFRNTTTYTEDSLAAGSWAYDATAQVIYVRLIRGGSPFHHNVFIGDIRRGNGLDIKHSDSFVVDGITVMHAPAAGILVIGSTSGGPKARLDTVKNCTASYCFKPGIELSLTANASVQNDTTFSNGDHGIYVERSDTVSVTRSLSYLNDDPLKDRGGEEWHSHW